MAHGSGPHPDSFTLSDVGRGRWLGLGRRSFVLERQEGERWIEVERFRDPAPAGVALDALMASGVRADHLRMRREVRLPDRLVPIGLAVFIMAGLALLAVILLR
jgi:hypothetical protein